MICSFDDLVRAYQVGRVSYKYVVFFQLEEFRDIPRTDSRSFAWRLYDYFFKFVDANPHNVFFLNGTSSDFDHECELFEDAIKRYGGINLMCVQVSSEASIGGNAPGSCLTSRTRPKTTTSFVINDRSYTRNGLGDVAEEDIIPEDEYAIGSNYVLTMGLGTIMDAEEVIALFIGPPAARALHHVLEGSVSNMFPASILQYHARACIVCEHRSISTLKFTTVEYFMGIRENFNIVNSLPALQTTRRRRKSPQTCRRVAVSPRRQVHAADAQRAVPRSHRGGLSRAGADRVAVRGGEDESVAADG